MPVYHRKHTIHSDALQFWTVGVPSFRDKNLIDTLVKITDAIQIVFK